MLPRSLGVPVRLMTPPLGPPRAVSADMQRLTPRGTASKDKDLEAKLAQAQASVEAQTREVARLEATLQERDVIIAVHLTPGGVRGRQAGKT